MTDREELVRALMGESDRRPVWPFLFLAVPIAAIWSFVSVPRGLPPSDGTPAGLANQIAYIVGYSLMVSIVTWVAFHLLVFSKRASLPTSFKMLGIIAIGAAAAPIAMVLWLHR